MSRNFAYDVFLSHSSADKPIVLPLAERLKAAGLRVWYDDWVIKAGDDIYLRMEQGLEASRTLVLCMSANAFGSKWVDMERATSLFRDPTNRERRFLPLLLVNCKIPDTLRRFKHIDARGQMNRAVEELLEACGFGQQASAAKDPGREGKAPELPALGNESRRILLGHPGGGSLSETAISADGKRGLSGGGDNMVRLWDLEGGICLHTLEGHRDWVRSVSLGADGKRGLSGSDDGTVRLWDLEVGTCLHTLEGHRGAVNSVSLGADGKRGLSGDRDGTVRVWDLEGGTCLHILEGHSDWVYSVSLGADGKRGLSVGGDNMFRLWDLEAGTCLRTLEGHSCGVDSVSLSIDGRLGLSGGDDGTVRLWDLKVGTCLLTLEGHGYGVSSVSLGAYGRLGLSGGDDGTVRLWDLESGTCLHTLEGHCYGVRSVSLGADGDLGLSGDKDGTVCLWDLEAGTCLHTLEGHSYGVNSVSLGGDGRLGLSGGLDGTVRLWDLEGGTCLHTLEGHSDGVNSVSLGADGRLGLSGGNDGTVRLWDLEGGTCLHTLEGHSDWVYSVSLGADGRLGLSGGRDGTVRVWDLEGGTCLHILEGHTQRIVGLGFSPVSHRVYAASQAGILRVWDLDAAAPEAYQQHTYANAKVVLLGKSGVGKSGLAHRLIHDEWVETESTHGMNVHRLELPGLVPQTPRHIRIDREVLLWDLAGQHDYRIVHQFFLGETALALVLINRQDEDPFSEALDWKKALSSVTKHDVPSLLVAARIDWGTTAVSSAKIEEFRAAYGFTDYVETSAMRGDNCSDSLSGAAGSALKQLIARHIDWGKIPVTNTPALLFEIKKAILRLREQPECRLYRFVELATRLRLEMPGLDFDNEDLRTAVRLLDNHGLVLPLAFGDLVLLQPELLNGYASQVVLTASQHPEGIGCVREEEIYGLGFNWGKVNQRLNRPDEELLLRAMVQTFLEQALCIAEDSEAGRQLIFPSQYRRDRDLEWHPEIHVIFTCTGEWQTVYTTLVVRLWYSNTFDNKELWRNAAEFTTTEGHAAGFRVKHLPDGAMRFDVFFEREVPASLKAVMVEFVHRHLLRYAREVERLRRHVCQECGKPVLDDDAVRARRAAGKDFITCQHCDEKVHFVDHLEERLQDEPLKGKLREMEAHSTESLDTQSTKQILISHLQAITGEAGHLFHQRADHGIDGEVEFRDGKGHPSGKKIYVQLKGGGSHLRKRKRDGEEIFDIRDGRHIAYWQAHHYDVWLVVRDAEKNIRWMNITDYLRIRQDKESRQVPFRGELLTLTSIWKVRDRYFPPNHGNPSAKPPRR